MLMHIWSIESTSILKVSIFRNNFAITQVINMIHYLVKKQTEG
jgi:hypothetical protein